MLFVSSLVSGSVCHRLERARTSGLRLTSIPGLAESSFYPGMQYVIGSWYRKDELAKRSCIFHVSSAIATMCSGYLMAAVYHLGGTSGYAGWQWSVFSSKNRHLNVDDTKTKVIHS